MHGQESVRGSWPVASDPLQLEACEMEILKPCRHHILNLGCRSTAASLSSVPLPFPGQFVQLQYVVALVNNNSKELIDCRMFSFGNRQFKIINLQDQRKDCVYLIETEIELPAGQSCLVQASSVDCLGNELPHNAGKFTFLLPADSPGIFHINFRFKSVGILNNSCDEQLIHEINTSVTTHYAPKNLSDFWDGHTLPAINLPIPRKAVVGILGTPEGQKVVGYFQTLVENGAHHCFERDRDRFLRHESSSNPYVQDLVLAIQLEASLLLYQRGNLEECKKCGEDVCFQAHKFSSPNYNFLVGKAKSVVSGAYKQQGNFEKAAECLELSTEVLEAVVPGEETAVNRTCFAALLSEKAAIQRISATEKNDLRKAMRDALLHYSHQLNQNLNRNARAPRRSLIRFIFCCLHSSRKKAPNMGIPVSDEDFKDAESCIEHFLREFLEDCPIRDNVLFCCALGDVFAIKGEYEEGISVLSESLIAAEELQLNEDLIGIRDRLQQLYMLRQRAEQNGRISLEIPAQPRMMRNNGFQEPPFLVLQEHLDNLALVMRCR